MESFEITEVLTHPVKQCVMVSFNGKEPEYYEYEQTDDIPLEVILQTVADNDELVNG